MKPWLVGALVYLMMVAGGCSGDGAVPGRDAAATDAAIGPVADAARAQVSPDGTVVVVAVDAATPAADAAPSVDDAAPAMADASADDAAAALADAAQPAADAAATVPDAAATVADAAPLAPDAAPLAPDAAPLAPDAAPLAPDAAPLAPDAGTVLGVPPEIDGRITINELMAYDAVTLLDDTGLASDWIELYNPNPEAISLAGYGLSDSLALPRRAVLPAGVVVPGHGYLVLWADHAPERGPRHLGFRLRREGGDVVLERPDGSAIDRVSYGAQEADFSAARTPDGSDRWTVVWHATPGAANPAGSGAPVGPEVTSAPAEQAPAAGDLSERILGYDRIPELELVLSPGAIVALGSAPYTDVPGHIVFDGRSYGPVGVRLKGQNSFEPITAKPSLRINIDQYIPRARFFGLKDLTLDNMDNDLSMMHERLAYRVARLAGVPASRCNHALVSINGTFYGLYANVETVKRKMIARWFPQSEGALFEGTDDDFTASFLSHFELESGPADRSQLAGTISALALTSPDAAVAAADGYLDMAEFRRYWALASVIGQFDALPYSNPGDDYLLYADPATHKLRFLPWGMDETFYSASFPVTQVRSILAQRCRDAPACFQAYVNQTWDLLAMTEAMDLDAEAARVATQIAPFVLRDTRKRYSDATVAASQRDLHFFVSERRADLTLQLPARSP